MPRLWSGSFSNINNTKTLPNLEDKANLSILKDDFSSKQDSSIFKINSNQVFWMTQWNKLHIFELQNQHPLSYPNPRSCKGHIQFQKPTQTVATNQKTKRGSYIHFLSKYFLWSNRYKAFYFDVAIYRVYKSILLWTHSQYLAKFKACVRYFSFWFIYLFFYRMVALKLLGKRFSSYIKSSFRSQDTHISCISIFPSLFSYQQSL